MSAKFAIIECAIGKGKKPNSADALTDEEIEEFYYLSPWELTYNYITNMKTSITYLNFFINICKMDTNLNIIIASKRPNFICMHKVG